MLSLQFELAVHLCREGMHAIHVAGDWRSCLRQSLRTTKGDGRHDARSNQPFLKTSLWRIWDTRVSSLLMLFPCVVDRSLDHVIIIDRTVTELRSTNRGKRDSGGIFCPGNLPDDQEVHVATIRDWPNAIDCRSKDFDSDYLDHPTRGQPAGYRQQEFIISLYYIHKVQQQSFCTCRRSHRLLDSVSINIANVVLKDWSCPSLEDQQELPDLKVPRSIGSKTSLSRLALFLWQTSATGFLAGRLSGPRIDLC